MDDLNRPVYNEDGRLIKAQILVGICSPSTSGKAVDPTTLREYLVPCSECGSEDGLFTEDPEMNYLKCFVCGHILAVRAVQDTLQ